MVRTRQPPDVMRAEPRPRIALDQHAEELPDLIDIVAPLPPWRGPRQQIARRGQRVHGVRRDAALVALLSNDAEVAELEASLIAHEHVERREIAMQPLAAMQFPEHAEDAGDLAPRRRLREAR